MNIYVKDTKKEKKISAITKAKTQKAKQHALRSIKKLEETFSDTINTSFLKTIIKIPELAIQKKVDKNKRQQQQRKQITNIKKTSVTSVTSVTRCYGMRTSLKKRNESRMLLSYETKESASERLTPTNKSHTVNYDNVTWNKKHLLDKVKKSIKENELINWNEIGSRFDIKKNNNELAKNIGQIAQEFVRNKGIDVESITRKRKNQNQIIRRCKRRIQGTEFSFPTETTNNVLRQHIQSKIDGGEYDLGIPILSNPVKKYKMVKSRKKS